MHLLSQIIDMFNLGVVICSASLKDIGMRIFAMQDTRAGPLQMPCLFVLFVSLAFITSLEYA